MEKILNDIKVLELATVLAGPAVGTFFAELGAEVTKVEPPTGDVTRSWKHKNEDKNSNVSAYFSSVNHSKKYIRLNLKDESDRDNFYKILPEFDIVITNYKLGDEKKLKVDFESLLKIKPNLIYGTITGYGDDDARPAYDAVLQAETGFMSINGSPNDLPLKLPIAIIDVLAAHQLKEGLLLALLHRAKTGKGARVSVSLYETAIASLVNQSANWLMLNEIPQRLGSLHPNIAPYGETFLTLDNRYFLLAVGSDTQFNSLCDILNKKELITDERFSSNVNRVKNRVVLAEMISQSFLLKSAEEWNMLFLKKNIPGGIVKNINEVFADTKTGHLLIEEMIDGVNTKRVQNSIFNIEYL